MRRRTEIEEQIAKLPLSEGERIIIELLLDMRHITYLIDTFGSKEDI